MMGRTPCDHRPSFCEGGGGVRKPGCADELTGLNSVVKEVVHEGGCYRYRRRLDARPSWNALLINLGGRWSIGYCEVDFLGTIKAEVNMP